MYTSTLRKLVFCLTALLINISLICTAHAGERPVLGVAPLSHEVPNVRNGLAAVFTQELTGCGRVDVLPAVAMGELLDGAGIEHDKYHAITPESLKLLSDDMDLLVVGEVTALTVATKDRLFEMSDDYNDLKPLLRNDQDVAQVGINLRVIKVSDGTEVLNLSVEGLESKTGTRIDRVSYGWAGSVDFLSDDFRRTRIGRATYKAVGQFLYGIYELYPVTGKVLAVTGDAVVIDLDGRSALELGDELTVHHVNEIKDQAGTVVWTDESRVGSVQVVEFQPGKALCLIVEGHELISEGDLAHPLTNRMVLPMEADQRE